MPRNRQKKKKKKPNNNKLSLHKGVSSKIGEDSNSWIMSYADTVTLLLCFFIIFFAEQSKKADQDVLIELSRDMKKSQGEGSAEKEEGRKKSKMLSEIESDVRAELSDSRGAKTFFGVEKRRREVLIRLYERDFFHVGHFKLKPNGNKVLKGVADLLRSYQDKILIKVEGHSDSLAVNSNPIFESNLDLSSLRASKAAHVLMSHGFDEDRIRVVGYGAARPLVNDRSPSSSGSEYIPEKGVMNRRIELRILLQDEEADGFMEVTP